MAFYHTAFFVITVMIVCNAILYPTIFSSIFRRWFGGTPPKPEKEVVPEFPPHMRTGPGVRGGSAGRMRSSQGGSAGKPPMPAAGGAGGGGSSGGVDPSNFMGQQAQESKGRGMMGTVLPVYAVGIFIYFGYVIYKVFLRDKPSTPTPATTWNYSDEASQQQGPTLQRQQQENLQRKLAAELKAANYPELKKSDKRAAEVAAASAAAAALVEGSSKAPAAGSNEEVDVLKRRLEETEKTMQRMMDMMNSMGVAMGQVSQHLANEKPIPPSMVPDFSDPKLSNDEDDLLGIDVDNLSDEEDLIIGDCMDPCGSSDEENDVSSTRDDIDDDFERRRPNKMNIVDVEADDYHDDEDDDDVDSDDELEEENSGVDDVPTSDTVRRRNVKGSDGAEGTGIEG